MQLCIGIQSSKQHIVISMLSEPLEMHILASILWTSRVFFKLCCQELVHIAQNRRNRDSPATNSWPLRPFHAHFPSVPSPSLHRCPRFENCFFRNLGESTQFCKVNGNSMGLPVFFFTPLRISRRYAVSANKTGAQSPCLPPEMELARQEMNYFYNSWLDLKGSIWKRDLCDRPL